MDTENKAKYKFIKRIAEIYVWRGSHGDEVDEALVKLFGKSGADLEEGVDGKLSFIPSKKRRRI